MKRIIILLSALCMMGISCAMERSQELRLSGFVEIPSGSTQAELQQDVQEEMQEVADVLAQQPEQVKKKGWFSSWKRKVAAVPKGLGYVVEVIRLLSTSRSYLDETLTSILQEEENNLSSQEKETLKKVREAVSQIIKEYEKELVTIRKTFDKDKQAGEVDAKVLEFLKKISFIQYVQQSNPLGVLSYDAHLLLLLTFLKDIRMQEEDKKTEKSEIFVKWSEFVTHFTAELLNTHMVTVNGQKRARNPYSNIDAQVIKRQIGHISRREKEFLSARQKKTIAAQRKLIEHAQHAKGILPVNVNTGLKIGLVFSGGGYRAMTLTAGYMEALEQLGLLDASLYMSTLSGSTWFLAGWLQSRETVAHFNEVLSYNMNTPLMNVEQLARIAFGQRDRKKALHYEIMFPKFAFKQPIGTVDLYGWLLSQAVLNNDYTSGVSDQWSLIQDGSYPFPIYTTISMHNIGSGDKPDYRYNWYEVNPLEFENIERGLAIPVWSLGREFRNGTSIKADGLPTYPYAQNLGYMLGIFGSAYTINFLKEGAKFAKGWAGTFLSFLQKIKTIKRLWPAQSNNPWFGLDDQPEWIQNKELLTFVDAGIDFNLPVAPLLKSERDLDVIIIGDASGGIERKTITINKHIFPQELGKFILYLHDEKFDHTRKEYEIANLKYELDKDYNKVPFIVYEARQGVKVPTLIYINYQKDQKLIDDNLKSTDAKLKKLAKMLKDFDPIRCEENDFCSTFNFKYTKEQFDVLKSMGQFNVLAHKDQLKEVIEAIFVNKSLWKPISGELMVMGAYNGDVDFVKSELAKGVDPNVLVEGVPGEYVNDAIAPLHAAVLGGHIDVIKYLLENNATIDQKIQSENPLHNLNSLELASKLNNVKVSALLLEFTGKLQSEFRGKRQRQVAPTVPPSPMGESLKARIERLSREIAERANPRVYRELSRPPNE